MALDYWFFMLLLIFHIPAREIATKRIKTERKESPLKKKVEARRSRTKTVSKKTGQTEKPWRTDKIKSLVSRLATSISKY